MPGPVLWWLEICLVRVGICLVRVGICLVRVGICLVREWRPFWCTAVRDVRQMREVGRERGG